MTASWTKARLDQLILDQVEEGVALEYKRAEALGDSDKCKVEITKDASAFANSSGGVLIYGIAEPADKAKRHLPERIAPLSRQDCSKERLEQLIQMIQPRINGVVIHPVEIDAVKNLVCYAVEIPASHTAHQARDHVYYKRHNFNVLPMEDYEVRDVMNRRTNPDIRALIWFQKAINPPKLGGALSVTFENVGPILARHAMVKLELPICMEEYFAFDTTDAVVGTPKHSLEQRDNKYFYRLRARHGQSLAGNLLPLFPGDAMTVRFKVNMLPKPLKSSQGVILESTNEIRATVFADSSPPVTGVLSIQSVLQGYTRVEPF